MTIIANSSLMWKPATWSLDKTLMHMQKAFLGMDESVLYGGNIFFDDGHVEYESTLNIHKEREGVKGRVIEDPNVTAIIDDVLYSWWVE